LGASHAKRTLAGPQDVLDYLSRYTTKTALSNHRLLGLDDQGNVRLSWRDRANGNRRRILQLPAARLLDRFVLHVLPPGLVRIRHIGLLANRHKRQQLAQARAALAAPAPAPTPAPKESAQQLCLRVLGIDIERCPACRLGRLRIVAQIPPAHAPYQARAP
jgi:Putative transposase